MIIPDVNVLVHGFKESAEHHHAARAWLDDALAGEEDLGLVELVLVGVIRLVTNPRIFQEPASATEALAFVAALRTAPRARALAATDASWARMEGLVAQDRAIRGNLVPDAYLASIALAHGGTVATADRGFARFPGLRWFDPVDRTKLS